MNDLLGNLSDQRIRQALDSLPDAPPPGSSFNAARLWDQLRPELATQPVSALPQKNRRRWWLVAAACMGLLLGGWWWLAQHVPNGIRTGQAIQVAVSRSPQQRTQPQPVHPQLADKAPMARRKTPVQRFNLQPSGLHPVINESPPPIELQPATRSEPVADVPESVAAAPAETYPAAPVLPPNRLKRRFAVVHQNELRAEAETQAKLERNDQFVRLGVPSPTTPSKAFAAPADEPSGLIIPLN